MDVTRVSSSLGSGSKQKNTYAKHSWALLYSTLRGFESRIKVDRWAELHIGSLKGNNMGPVGVCNDAAPPPLAVGYEVE